MKKRNLLIITIMSIIISAAFALPPMETVRKRQVGPGVVQTILEAPAVPWVIHVLEADLEDPDIRVEAVDGGGLQGPSVMAREEETPEKRLVGTVNGDFFSASGQTTNHGVVDGQIVKLETYSSDPQVYWPALGINDEQKLHIACHKFSGKVASEDDEYPLAAVNAEAAEDQLVLYNHYYGDTLVISKGIALRLQPQEEWAVNAPVRGEIVEKYSGKEVITLNKGTVVLAGKGSAADFLEEHERSGDILSLYRELRPFEDRSAQGVSYHYLPPQGIMRYLTGGYPTLVRKGENAALEAYAHQGGTGSFATDLHPRTAVGFDRDTSTMYLVVVDGRQSHSAGIDLPDLADIMIKLGAWSAMNFDGGGSSVMIVGDEIQNSPSDGHERAVRNCAAVFSTAPRKELSRLQFDADTLRVFYGEEREFAVSGWDANWNPAEIDDWSQVSVYGAGAAGSVRGERGSYTFTALDNDAGAYIYASTEGVTGDSLYVQKRPVDRIRVSPQTALVTPDGEVRIRVRGIRKGGSVAIPADVMTFRVKDSDTGSIGPDGVFRAASPGKTLVTVQYGEMSDSVTVIVSDEIR